MELMRIQFQSMPALGILKELGLLILALAVVLRIFRESRALLQGGSPDFITPLVEAAFVAAIVSNIPWFGTAVAELANDLSIALLDRTKLGLFEVTYQKLSVSAGDLSLFDLGGQTFTLRVLLGAGSLGLFLLMMLAKIVVLDLLWPVCFGLVLLLGTIALPVGLLPGMGGFTGWSKNLVEVTLWPVVFAILASLMAGAFGGYLETASQLDLKSMLSPSPFDRPDSQSSVFPIFDVLRFWGLCTVYLVCLFASPLFALFITRGTPIGLVAGAGLGAAVRVVSSAAGLVLGPWAGALASAGSSALTSAFGKTFGSGSKPAAPSLDQRQNHPPTGRLS